MTWPLQPIGPRPNEPLPITPVERLSEAKRRADDEARREQRDGRRRREQQAPGEPPVADGDGHIDVLA